MQRTDRALGTALALLSLAVLWTARGFPDVPGQKVGAGFLPLIVGACLFVCALLLVRRSFDARRYSAPELARASLGSGRMGAAFVVLAAMLGYILLAERLGFLIVAPLMLVASFRAFAVGWRAALLWAIVGSVVVHLAFYKLLRVPLPWGLLRPWY